MSDLNLAAIGNCAVASLISRTGEHRWFCFPLLDGDPVFNSLLGGVTPERGFMDVVLRDGADARQDYLRNTPIVETLLNDLSHGVVRILDFAPRFKRYGRLFRPPIIVRRIEPLAGRPRIKIRLRPSFNYGADAGKVSRGSNHVRYFSDDVVLRVTTDAPLGYILNEAEFTLDRPVNLIIGPDETQPDSPDSLARNFLNETQDYWWEWVRDLNVPFDFQDEIIRAAITLKLCSYEDTGAILAALTTSVPEAANSERNWDYRLCWLRDAFFTVSALNRLSVTLTMESFVRYVIDTVQRTEDQPIAPLFPATPGLDLTERIATALPGYRGFGPVRVGNAASAQQQNDVYGSIVLTAAQMFWDRRLPQQADQILYRQLASIGRTAARVALEPDASLWEYRGRVRRHTYSAAMCWAALHRLGMIARHVGLEADAADWVERAGQLREQILGRALTAEGWLSGALDEPVMDASILMLPDIGLVAPSDPAFRRTIDVLEQRLVRNGFVMRYDEADDFGPPQNAFLICTFWYIDALARTGRRDQALELFKNVLSRRNHVGLLSEDIDPASGELWGNFPQTYSQVGLILSATRLSRSWEEGLWRAS